MKRKIIGFFRLCDLLTMSSILFSFIGIMLAVTQHFTIAVFCLLLSGVCDGFDGKLARMRKNTKEEQVYGVQMDSLADVICFGVTPAIITILISPFLISKIIACFFVLCGVIRLAYFNMLDVTGKAVKGVYIGVPITTVSFVYFLIFFIIRFIKFSLLAYVLPVVLVIMGTLFILNIKVKKINVDKIVKFFTNKCFFNYVLFPLIILFVCNVYFRFNASNAIFNEIMNVKSNIIPSVIFFLFFDFILLLLNSIFNNSKVTKIIICLLLLILMTVNDIKFYIMGIPIELSDVDYLNPANISMMGTATTTIGSWIYGIILKSLIVFVIFLLLILFDKFTRFEFKKKCYRIFSLLGSILVICGFVILYKSETVYKIYNSSYDELISYNTVYEIYDKYGFFQGLIINGALSMDFIPDGFNEKEISSFTNSFKDEDDSWGKANVVFILSETFSNFENVDELFFDKNLTPNFDRFSTSEDGMVFDLLVPSIYGVSVNTEFEVLTGSSISFLKAGYIPYNSYYSKLTFQKSPSIIKEFNNNGYTTMYLTPWSSTSYNSKYVYSGVGTDVLKYDVHTGKDKGVYYSDQSLMEDIFDELKDTSKDNYKFIMTATAENHYPYSGNKFDKYDIDLKNNNMSDEDKQLVLNYAQGIYDADKSLGWLYDKIQKLDVPTIIVFFGDHMPLMENNSGYSPYLDSSYFNTDNSELNNLRTYTTRGAILANFDLGKDEISYINSSYLGAYVLSKMDLKIDNYYLALDSLREDLPIFNRSVAYVDGNIIPLSSLSDKYKEAYQNYRYLQYWMLYDYTR